MNNKNPFNRFNDIEHIPLRVYNRTVMMLNIQKDHGKEALEEYILGFNTGERKAIAVMLAAIKTKGPDAVMKAVTRGLTIVDE